MIQDLSTQDKGKGSGYITEDGKGIQKKKKEKGGGVCPSLPKVGMRG